jgi:predicted alpha/beta-fold hydrolase
MPLSAPDPHPDTASGPTSLSAGDGPDAFAPARWARNPHLQTLFARALRSKVGPEYTRERVDTPDGDFLDLDWAPEPSPGAPLALVLHGLEGNARRRYVRNLARELLARGVRPVALNFRACSGEPNRTARFYHSGETGDSAFVLRLLRERHPDRKLGAMGFSLGGNVLLKLMGEREDGGVGLLDAAAALSVPYDLAAGGVLLEGGAMGRFYTAYFIRSLRKKVRAKRALLEGILDVEGVLAARTLREFDDLATAPLHGFRDADHYYAESSSARYLDGIRVPTLLLHAEDDPFLPPSAIPRAAMHANAALTSVVTPAGGHVGHLMGSPRSPRFWGEERAATHLADALR